MLKFKLMIYFFVSDKFEKDNYLKNNIYDNIYIFKLSDYHFYQ